MIGHYSTRIIRRYVSCIYSYIIFLIWYSKFRIFPLLPSPSTTTTLQHTPLVAIHLLFLLNLLCHLQHYQLHHNHDEYWKGTIQYVALSRKNSHLLHNILQNKKFSFIYPLKYSINKTLHISVFETLTVFASL